MARPDLHHIKRKLAAILQADVAGYSRLMSADEEATLQTLQASRTITDSLIAQYQGRIVGTAGDSILAEFTSVVEAVECAVEIQQALKTRNSIVPPDQRMEFRIGINLGDVMVEGEQIYGEGVNIAARLESLADPGGIHLSGTAYDQVKNKLPLDYDYLGEQAVKNITEPVRVYRVGMEDSTSQNAKVKGQKSKVENRIGSAYRSRTALIAAGILIAVGALAFSFLSPFIIHRSSFIVQEAQPPSLSLPDKPSIAVLPFVNMSDDPKQEYFSDGITEDITSDLSKVSSLFVISRNSAFTYKGKAVKIQEVSRELGVQYVVEGSVRKAGDQVRITAQLIDATKDQHLWSDRYDRPLTELFTLQDEIRQKIVFALKVKLTPEEQARFQRAPTNNLEAYDFYLRGRELSLRALQEESRELNEQARQRYEKAIELDPQYAGAYGWLGWTYFQDWFYQWNKDRTQSLERAFALAQQAVGLNDSISIPHWILGVVYLWKKQHDQAIAEGERAVALDVNDTDSYVSLGNTLVFAGRPEAGIKLIEQAMRLNPRYPPRYLNLLGLAYRKAGRCEEALVPLKKALTLSPNFGPARFNAAVCYAELGRLEEAQVEAAEILRINPNASLENVRRIMPYKDPTDIERDVTAMRKAGLK